MHTPPLAGRTSYVPWTSERLAGDSSTTPTPSIPRADVDIAIAPRMPVEHLERAPADRDVLRELMSCLAAQARAIALVREAHSLGAASMPPEVAAALAAATSAIPAMLRGGSLPIV
ncbi:MAG TPA: hypothetical protein VEA99_01260 [Gemmatimonadaceae bacterium]|nr:hypothetical protein [Gemmatimonadaceae bacterium]